MVFGVLPLTGKFGAGLGSLGRSDLGGLSDVGNFETELSEVVNVSTICCFPYGNTLVSLSGMFLPQIRAVGVDGGSSSPVAAILLQTMRNRRWSTNCACVLWYCTQVDVGTHSTDLRGVDLVVISRSFRRIVIPVLKVETVLWSAKTQSATAAFSQRTAELLDLRPVIRHVSCARRCRVPSLASPMPHQHQCHVGDMQATEKRFRKRQPNIRTKLGRMANINTGLPLPCVGERNCSRPMGRHCWNCASIYRHL